MTRFLQFFSLGLAFFFLISCESSPSTDSNVDSSSENTSEQTQERSLNTIPSPVKIGAETLLARFESRLQGKRIAIVGNHTTRFPNGTHLVDSLISRGFNVKKVFAPEHGFRGTADAGEAVASGMDQRTGLPLISLYGKNKKPNATQLEDVDLVIFDIQDIGVRLYTYISTLTYVMEACAELGKPVMVLDRPNPNGWYIDGPVLQKGSESFVGMHPIPVVHGMSIGEYAEMVNGEGWLKNGVKTQLEVIPCQGYTHNMRWSDTGLDWIAPSPNMGTEYAAYLYPALVWFEPTPVSVGRGTDTAFTVVGTPWYGPKHFSPTYQQKLVATTFTPVSLPGKSKYPKFENTECEGFTFEGRTTGKELILTGLELFQNFHQQYLAAFKNASSKDFFDKGFHKWPGYKDFQQQISENVSAEEIYNSWQEETEIFREMRKKYLIYP